MWKTCLLDTTVNAGALSLIGYWILHSEVFFLSNVFFDVKANVY